MDSTSKQNMRSTSMAKMDDPHGRWGLKAGVVETRKRRNGKRLQRIQAHHSYRQLGNDGKKKKECTTNTDRPETRGNSRSQSRQEDKAQQQKKEKEEDEEEGKGQVQVLERTLHDTDGMG